MFHPFVAYQPQHHLHLGSLFRSNWRNTLNMSKPSLSLREPWPPTTREHKTEPINNLLKQLGARLEASKTPHAWCVLTVYERGWCYALCVTGSTETHLMYSSEDCLSQDDSWFVVRGSVSDTPRHIMKLLSMKKIPTHARPTSTAETTILDWHTCTRMCMYN